MIRTLPCPIDRRWKPMRAGLVDVFYYDVEEFWFRDGRLLLRGNNGTGKSKVLALLLPFLLDGDLSAHRVEPDADPRKRMEWNLLLGGAHPHQERIGYTWLEFGRRDEHGVEHFRTIGCGMKAVAGKGVSPWYFVTSARVGEDLHLVDKRGAPLAKDRLSEALGEFGHRYDKAREYRRAIDEALFGLGEQRYGALVDLLIQLRQPQLSKKPTEAALSKALTESLPPLGQAILVDVAEAFRSLEEDRVELADMREAMVVATGFLDHYRRYGQVATRRKAELSRKAQSRYEHLNRELGEANRDFTEAVEQLATVDTRIDVLADEEGRLRERRQGLYDSDAMDSARGLDAARKLADQAAESAERVAGFRDEAESEAQRKQHRFDASQTYLESANAAFDLARVATRNAAVGAAIADPHEQEVDAHLETLSTTDLRRAAAALVARQGSAIDNIYDRITAVESAHSDLLAARKRSTELDERTTDLAERRRTADEAVQTFARQLVQTTREYLGNTVELLLTNIDDLLDELTEWALTLGGENPVITGAAGKIRSITEQLTRDDAAAEAVEVQLGTTLRELTDELARLEAGETEAPPTRYTLDPVLRENRTGAPLWRVVDFADHLGASARAGVEAALEAAGVLDAWLTADGRLIASGEIVVTATDPAPGAALSDVLRPAIDPDADVSESAVLGVLAAIGLGSTSSHHSWIDVDGRFRVGVLHGAWQKPAPQYVGAGAREEARRRRISVLHSEIERTTATVADVAGRREVLRERRMRLDAEFAALPPDAVVRAAHDVVSALTQEYFLLKADVEATRGALDNATIAHRDRTVQLEADARDCALPTDRELLRAVETRLADYRVEAARLWGKVDALATARTAADSARADLERALLSYAGVRGKAAEEQREAAGRREYLQTLQANVGAEVEELQRSLKQVAVDLKVNAVTQKEVHGERDDCISRRGGAASRRELLTGELDSATADRLAAAEALRHYANTGLITVALPDMDVPDPSEPWAPNPTVLLARSIEAALESVNHDDKTFERLQARVSIEHKSLGDVLSRQGNSTSAQPVGDSIVVEVVFRGKVTSVPDLAQTLESEVADRSRLLTAREREILENHLVSEVASTLQELIVAAEQQVVQMNRELDARPTSTGMKLRLYWEPGDEAPAGAAAALRQLRQTADAWNESDRAAVGEFLQGEIQRVRTDRVGGTWLEHLTEALDYRRWNRFVIKRHQNGQWRSAVGPGSGGENALVASVPLFAAASAHYSSAGNPDAPRLVTLDEAFAGVDDNARAKYLGLLAAFDLDVVMTSEREWGCYPEVPGLAIAHLSRIDGIDAVLVTNWEWDGRVRNHVERPAPELTQQSDDDDDPGPQDGLWSPN